MNEKFQFKGILEILDSNPSYSMVSIPSDIISTLPEKGRLRTIGTLNGAPFSLAIHGRKNGSGFFMIGSALKKTAKITKGDVVEISFSLTDPDFLELPEELQEVMAQDEEASKIFFGMTVGMQRSLAHYVSSVRNTDSRIKRALELAYKMKNDELYLQRANKNKSKA
ncbi:MAG: YdeI/OmpD-associated family protein [Bacteroidia bacterium]